jgi:cytochrome bd-type quinol oxidase subunit 2
MDAIVWLVLMLVSAWLAYMAVSGERHLRAWQPVTAVGLFLALFGGIAFGLNTVWDRFFRPKLVDDFASPNTLLFVGLIIVAALVVLVLDLLGTIDVMSKVQGAATSRADTIRRPPAGPAGPGPTAGPPPAPPSKPSGD